MIVTLIIVGILMWIGLTCIVHKICHLEKAIGITNSILSETKKILEEKRGIIK
jgi:hypothetical protein